MEISTRDLLQATTKTSKAKRGQARESSKTKKGHVTCISAVASQEKVSKREEKVWRVFLLNPQHTHTHTHTFKSDKKAEAVKQMFVMGRSLVTSDESKIPAHPFYYLFSIFCFSMSCEHK